MDKAPDDPFIPLLVRRYANVSQNCINLLYKWHPAWNKVVGYC